MSCRCSAVPRTGKANPSEVRGTGGPLNVSESRLTRPVIDAWVDAAEGLGYKRNDDYNGEDQEGVGHFQMTMRNGRRCSSATAFLKPARGRSNLHIFTGAKTLGLIMEGRRAAGIRVRQGDRVIEARRAVKWCCPPGRWDRRIS